MTLYSPPPPARSFRDDKATLLVCWWCTIFAAVIIIFRICGRYIRTERLFREDWLAFACMIPLFTRMALVHVVLLYGTNNTQTQGLSDEAIRKREIGSKLVLASRVFYAATLWMLKLTISEFFKRLISNIWRRSHEITLITIRWFLLATFVAVVIADLAECKPLTKAWQVVPDPGPKCRQGFAQLLTMGVADVITDLLLVFFPISIILSSTMRKKRKIELATLFAGSLLPAGTTLFRLPHIIELNGSQQYRSLLASVEILFATAVANALVLGSFVRDKGVKKQRWKFGSTSDSIERTTSRRPTMGRHWGSDEDLVRDLGIGLDPELRDNESFTPRPAPMATPALLNGRPELSAKARKMMGAGVESADWQFPKKTSTSESQMTDDDIDLIKFAPADYDRSPGDKTDVNSPRKISFFDVGGLLDDNPKAVNKRVSSIRTTESGESSLNGALASAPHNQQSNTSNFWSENGGLSPPPQKKGSAVLLQDIGGLLGPTSGGNSSPTIETKPKVQPKRGYGLIDILKEEAAIPRSPKQTPVRRGSDVSLKDVGGLLGPPPKSSIATIKKPSAISLESKPRRSLSRQSRDISRSRHREDKARFELKEILRQDQASRPPARSRSPMSKAKLRSAFDDLEPPRKASPTPEKDLAAQLRERDFGVQKEGEAAQVEGGGHGSKRGREMASVKGSKKTKNPLERHMSLQDVGGLLKS